jgi:putative PIN family toxin of toxin-antitoxin system
MRAWQIVLDTSVWIAALRSRRGASHRLLSLLGSGRFEIILSVPLLIEYEDVAKRLIGEIGLTESDIDDTLDYLCSVARHQNVHYLWRPFSPNPNDDMLIELAVAAQCDYIVTHNLRHFRGVERFGLEAVTPGEFLERIGELP